MSNDDLIERLWNSDEASALTNESARCIESLTEKLAIAEATKMTLAGDLALIPGAGSVLDKMVDQEVESALEPFQITEDEYISAVNDLTDYYHTNGLDDSLTVVNRSSCVIAARLLDAAYNLQKIRTENND